MSEMYLAFWPEVLNFSSDLTHFSTSIKIKLLPVQAQFPILHFPCSLVIEAVAGGPDDAVLLKIQSNTSPPGVLGLDGFPFYQG